VPSEGNSSLVTILMVQATTQSPGSPKASHGALLVRTHLIVWPSQSRPGMDVLAFEVTAWSRSVCHWAKAVCTVDKSETLDKLFSLTRTMASMDCQLIKAMMDMIHKLSKTSMRVKPEDGGVALITKVPSRC